MNLRYSGPSYLRGLFESYRYAPAAWFLFLDSMYGDMGYFLALLRRSQRIDFASSLKPFPRCLHSPYSSINLTRNIKTIRKKLLRYKIIEKEPEELVKTLHQKIKTLLPRNDSFKNVFYHYYCGNFRAAIDVLEKTQTCEDAGENWRTLWKGHLLFHMGEIPKARDVFYSLKTKAPETQWQLALIDLLNEKYDRVSHRLEELSKIKKENVTHSLYLCSLYQNPEHFFSHLCRIKGLLSFLSKEGWCELKKICEDNAENLANLFLRSEMFLSREEFAEAASGYQKILEQYPYQVRPVIAINNLACLLSRQKQFARAESLLQECVKKEPDIPLFVKNLSRLYSREIEMLYLYRFYTLGHILFPVNSLCFEDYPYPLMFTTNNIRMQELYETMEKVSKSSVNVLLHGENGVGKEIVARYLHCRSPRVDNPFVVIDCSSIPATLIESELFGYEKGAFTGAETSKAGKIEKAAQGTLFLDGITHIPSVVQAKLLRFIQFREYSPIGSTYTKKIDVRIVVSTTMNVEQALQEGYFRQDLFFRLNVLTLYIPSLRERTEDIVPLFEMFLKHYSQKYKKDEPCFSKNLRHFLFNYSWPGNIRELQNFTERLVLLGEKEAISLQKTQVERPCHHDSIPTMNLKELEKSAMKKALHISSSNREAAEMLGINPSTLWRKLKNYDMYDISAKKQVKENKKSKKSR